MYALTRSVRSNSRLVFRTVSLSSTRGQARSLASAAQSAAAFATDASATIITPVKEPTKVVKQVSKVEEREESQGADLFETLSPSLQKSLVALGVTALFPVQAQTLEACRAGKDMVVRSKTGSGKTLAFALPTVEKLMSVKGKSSQRGTPRAIVLAPTRELALQVHREFEKLAPTLNCVAVYGGASISTQSQQLRDTVDVVVGTPGRVKDFLDRGNLKLDQIKVAILDEADEMLKVGFYEAIQEIYTAMPPKAERQNLLFSATVSEDIKRICEDFLNKPTFVDLVGRNATKIPESVEMCATPVTRDTKESALSAILASHIIGSTPEAPRRALVFCSTKRECEELARTFHAPDASVSGGSLHGDMSQNQREDMLRKFRDGSCLVLVATDVAARGLDIPEVDLVVHYSLPRDHDSFIHRSGRTGRANRKGMNVILYEPGYESREIRDLERVAAMKFIRRAVPCGPEVVRRQADAIITRFKQAGAVIQWLKPVADELRRKDVENGTDSLAAALAAVMGGAVKLRVISALNGRAGNQTLLVEGQKSTERLDVDKLTKYLKTLPAHQESQRGALVRDLYRVKDSSAVLVDIPENYVADAVSKADEAGLRVEVVEGALPESVRDFEDSRDGTKSRTVHSASGGGYRSGGDRDRGYSGGNRGGYSRGGDRGGGDRSSSRGRSSSYDSRDRRGGGGGGSQSSRGRRSDY